MTDRDLKELLTAFARSRSDAAFTEIYKACQENVFKTAYGILGNYHDALSSRQETFTRLAEKAAEVLDRGAIVEGWLHITAKNCAYEILRKRPKKGEGSVPADAGKEPRPSATEAELRFMFGDDYDILLNASYMTRTTKKWLLQHNLLGVAPARRAEEAIGPPAIVSSFIVFWRWADWHRLIASA